MEALPADAVRVPGPLPARAMLHSPPAGRAALQLVAKVNPVTAIWRLAVSAAPRLRRVRLGESSSESASEASDEAAIEGMLSFAR